MGRGKHYSKWRHYAECAETFLYRDGWAASLAYSLRLQGRLVTRSHALVVGASTVPGSLRIAFTSDLHAGPLTDPRLFQSVAAAVAKFEPHLILLGGDYVSLHARHIEGLRRFLRALRAPCGVFAVLGNHDLWLDDHYIEAAISDAGVAVLTNNLIRLPPPFDRVVVFGLDEPGTGEPDASALQSVPRSDLRLLLMHSPLGLKHVDTELFDVAFSGHTHGGQIALPTGVPIVLPRGSGERKYAAGHFLLASGSQLLVSRGVGMSDVPVRLFAPSEVHLCTLSPAGNQEHGLTTART